MEYFDVEAYDAENHVLLTHRRLTHPEVQAVIRGAHAIHGLGHRVSRCRIYRHGRGRKRRLLRTVAIGGDGGDGTAGVREPRRPRPDPGHLAAEADLPPDWTVAEVLVAGRDPACGPRP